MCNFSGKDAFVALQYLLSFLPRETLDQLRVFLEEEVSHEK